MRPLVVYTDCPDTNPDPGIDLLESAGLRVKLATGTGANELVEQCNGASALLVGFAKIGREVLERLPDLRIVAAQSAGVDMIDVPACTARGVWVSNVPHAATEEVATHALAMSLALVRSVTRLDRDVRDGRWNPDLADCRRLSEMTVGVVGLGAIGLRYAALIAPMAREVVAYSRAARQVAPSIQQVSLREVFQRSDLVSVHVPLTDETEGMVNGELLDCMRPGSFLVNTSRGAVVAEADLLERLNTGHIVGAGLDVLCAEPPPMDHPLVSHDATIITPHVGFLSRASERDYVTTQARNVTAVLSGVPPHNPVNKPRVDQPSNTMSSEEQP